jgi:hypothetical protein
MAAPSGRDDVNRGQTVACFHENAALVCAHYRRKPLGLVKPQLKPSGSLVSLSGKHFVTIGRRH